MNLEKLISVTPDIRGGKPCIAGTRITGLMTIAPLATDAEQARPVFRALRALRDTLLPRLISGQLRLPEAQALLEGVAA